MPSITIKNATAVPSLKRLSPSKIIVSRRGAQSFLKIANTATGSVAEIRDPKSKHTKNGIWNQRNGNKKNRAVAIRKADIKNQKIASDAMVFQF